MNYPKSLPRVLLSIVTWNHEDSIEATIQSISKQNYPNIFTVVFDNNSTDKTLAILKEFEKEKMIVVRNNENIGFCGGHNYVIKNFDFDYIILVNPDIVLESNYIELAIRSFSIDPKIGAVCGLLMQSEGENSIVDSSGMKLMRSRRYSLINHGCNLESIKLESGYVTGLDGALPTFSKEAVQSISIDGDFFNPLFFAHKEDWDVSWRMILYGWKIYFNKNCKAIHPRHFKPNDLATRFKIDGKIKYDAFKNQLLLLLINEKFESFSKDAILISYRLLITTFFCLAFEQRSLYAFIYIFKNRKRIKHMRDIVRSNRKITCNEFRSLLTH